MQTISADSVDKIVESLASLKDTEAIDRVQTMSNEQPAIFAYLVATAETSLNEREQEHLISIGLAVWSIMRETSGGVLSDVSMETLEEVEENNIRMFDFLESEDDESDLLHSVSLIMENYNQPHVFEFVLESLMEIALGPIDIEADDDEEDSDLDHLLSEDIGFEFDDGDEDEDDESELFAPEEGDEDALSDDALGAMLLSLKTIIDCFDREN